MYLDNPCNMCGCDDWFINRDGTPFCRQCLQNTLDRITSMIGQAKPSDFGSRQSNKAVPPKTPSMGCLCSKPPCQLCCKNNEVKKNEPVDSG